LVEVIQTTRQHTDFGFATPKPARSAAVHRVVHIATDPFTHSPVMGAKECRVFS